MSQYKRIYIVNGMARCGKDTFAGFLNGLVPTHKYSSVTKIKEIAEMCGWNGGKTEKDRRFLSDLKILTTRYSDLAFNDLKATVDWFITKSPCGVLLIDIREPYEIHRAKNEFGAKTILIKNDRVPTISSNMADAGVYDYIYDYIIENNGTLDEFRNAVITFAEEEALCITSLR